MPEPFDYDQLASEQQASEELRSLLSSDTALRLKLFKPVGSNHPIYCDVSTPHIRPMCPPPCAVWYLKVCIIYPTLVSEKQAGWFVKNTSGLR
ncbi:hypothetical protein M513_11033 [Trichuris suis]|uniref:Uncharacterized protein n=1 Tax=Trichuris suis TaxID=68888 RepID=A0A085LSZ4_9BILA|nr:hypothetical protein M513_11033 [Trichuris suis]